MSDDSKVTIITEDDDTNPEILVISAYTMLAQKVLHLANSISDEDASKNDLINIECFTVINRNEVGNGNGKERRVVRFSIDSGVWFDISPLHEFTGSILEKNISVNLYDFFNILDNCKSDSLVSFWIDAEDNELVINSFYNPNMDCDELEVRLPIHRSEYPLIDRPTIYNGDVDSATMFALDATTTTSSVRELNNENLVDDIHIICSKGEVSFWSIYNNGLLSKLIFKDKVIYNGPDISIKIPFRIYNLIISTGEIMPLKCVIYNGDGSLILRLDANGYSFSIPIESSELEVNELNDIDLSNEISIEKILMVRVDDFNSMLQLVNRISKSAPLEYGSIVIDKVNDAMADFTLTYPGRYTVSARLVLAMLVDTVIKINGALFEDLLTKSGVDALSIYRVIDSNKLCIHYENSVSFKTMLYDHDKFMELRKG